MIKVMFAPLSYGDVDNGIWAKEAFKEAGCDIQIFDYFAVYFAARESLTETRKKFIDAVMSFQPHLLLLQIQHTNIIDGQSIARVKTALPKMKIANWTIDVRNYVPDTYKDVARFSDYNFISSTGQLDFFSKELSKPVQYLQIGYNPKLYQPSPQKHRSFDYDVVFVANNNLVENYPGRNTREAACQLLRNAFGKRFGLFGSNWPGHLGSNGSLDQRKVSEVYQKSVCSLSISHYNDLNHYFSDRLLMCMASGRPTVVLNFPKWESYFTDGCDFVIANSIDELVPKVKHLVQNPDIADFIGDSGAAKVFAEHTYLSRVNEMLDLVGLK